jgi:ribosomal protein S18 acetylase RimI-like enzyme
MPALNITLETDPAAADRDAIVAGLRAYNRRNAPAPEWKPLTLFLRDDRNQLYGGLIGETGWGWLHVYFLWVAEPVRRHGHGRRLLERAELEARARGCRGIHLDTHDFQAPGFYQAQGYEIFGVLDSYPEGFQRYFLRKTLAPPGEAP